jgi:dethiobiotin synthetase
MPPPGLFITGTDTDIGKTYVTCHIARQLVEGGHVVGAYKPAVSGAGRDAAGQPVWADIEELHAATGKQFPRERICPQRFNAPLAPPSAARAENRKVDAPLLRSGADWWRTQCDFLLNEGAGGLLSPIAEQETVADVAQDLGYPLIVIARLGLGTINHTLLTLEAATQRGLTVAGIVLNEAVVSDHDASIQTNAADLARFTDVPVLATLRYNNAEDIAQLGEIDWITLAAIE